MKISKFIGKNESGTALIEALLGLTFAVIVVTAVVTATITAVNNTNFTKNQNQATSLAQEGMGIARDVKEINSSRFFGPNGNYCVSTGSSPDLVEGDGVCAVGNFSRIVLVNKASSSCAGGSLVSSVVSWNDSRCSSDTDKCHKIQLDNCFYNLNTVINP